MSPRLHTNEPGIGGAATHDVPLLHLQAAGRVLAQDGEQAVVGVLGHAPRALAGQRVGGCGG